MQVDKGVIVGSGNVALIDASGRIPALSSTYFASVPTIFSSRMGDASLAEQFAATSTSDLLSFGASGGASVSFDPALHKLTFIQNATSTTASLASVLTNGADASSFTGTTKIGGTTLTSGGNATFAGNLTVSGTATSTIAGPLQIANRISNTPGNITLAPASNLIISSGNVGIGTTNPARVLHTVASSNAFRMDRGDNSLPFVLLAKFPDTTYSAASQVWGFGGIATASDFSISDLGTVVSGSGTTRLFIKASTGLVGIGTTAPGSLLSVAGGAAIGSTYATSTAPTNGLIVQGSVGIGTTSFATSTGPLLALANNTNAAPAAVANQGALYVSSGALKYQGPTTLTQLAAADYAEAMPFTGSLEPAELVSASDKAKTDADLYINFLVQRSSYAYDPHLMGVVSSFAPDNSASARMVALTGRAPVKVSLENGPITVGDRITSSSLPGIGMKATKAGQTVSIALQDFDEAQASSTAALLPNGTQVSTGTVLVFINVGYQGNDLSLTVAKDGTLREDDFHLIDAKGNVLTLTQDGDIVVKHLVVKDLEVAKGGSFTLPAGEGQIIGHATVKQEIRSNW